MSYKRFFSFFVQVRLIYDFYDSQQLKMPKSFAFLIV